jgi:KAP-like P-loop domain-containing protein
MEAPEAAETPDQPTNELIPDYAIVPGEDDLFSHGDYVDRLLIVLDEASTSYSSANIALYGSWGSGKSGVSNLLEDALDEDDRFYFVYFDAFKYARQPLLRNFIRQLASKLLSEKKAKEFRDRLYEETSNVRLRFPDLNRKTLKAIRWWSIVALAAVTLSVLAILVLTTGKAHDVALDFIRGVLPALLPSAVLISVVGLAARYLTISSKVTAPESEEQFEEIFTDLLRELNVDGKSDPRLVVFVDELDRCSPTEVVATLETLRTFLGVSGCLFVVAADQQVLEHALTEEVRQATPPDPANPYYSAGNAYLDKIFQYQLAFPPLRSRRLTHFALDLLEGRDGVWNEVDKEDVVSILLPTHINSPRRVKVLLNSYALSYGIARARVERRQLGEDLPERGSELAKLVCLKTEFPLFARDLALDDRLTQAVVHAAECLEQGKDPEQDAELRRYPVDIAERAVLYAREELPVATLLARPAVVGPEAPLLDYEDQVREADEAKPDVADSVEEDDDAATATEQEGKPVQRVHALQLVRYLEKTTDVPGPRSDLIHLEAAGAVWGLDPQIAQQLERDALDNRPAAVAVAVKSIPSGDERISALLMLGQLTRESVGGDAGNAARALLAAVAQADVSIAKVAPRLLGDVDVYRRRRGLRPEDLPGALSLALAANRSEFVKALLDRDEALEDANFRRSLLEAADKVQARDPERLGEICAREMLTDPDGAWAALVDLDSDLAAELLRSSGPHVVAEVEGTLQQARASEDTGGQEDAEAIRSGVATQVEGLSTLVRTLAEKEKLLGELALIALFSLPGEAKAKEPTFALVTELAPLETPQAAVALLEYVRGWTLPEIVSLIPALEAEPLLEQEDVPRALDLLARHLWTEASAPTEVPDELWEGLARFSKGGLRSQQTETRTAISDQLQPRIESTAAADEFDNRVALARRLADVGLVSSEVVADAALTAAAQTVRPAIDPPEQPRVLESLRSVITWASREGGLDSLRAAREALVADDCWADELAQETMRLYVEAGLDRFSESVDVPTLKQLHASIETHGAGFAEAAGVWVENFAASPRQAFRAIVPYVANLPDELAAPLARYSKGLDSKERAELCKPAIERAFALDPSSEFFVAAQLPQANEDIVAESIIQLFGDADNAEKRETVLGIWQLLDPTEAGARRRLIREVFLPLAASGTQAHELARRRLELCANPPHGTKGELVDALVASAPDKKRAKKLANRMAEVGLIEKKKNPLKKLFGL